MRYGSATGSRPGRGCRAARSRRSRRSRRGAGRGRRTGAARRCTGRTGRTGPAARTGRGCTGRRPRRRTAAAVAAVRRSPGGRSRPGPGRRRSSRCSAGCTGPAGTRRSRPAGTGLRPAGRLPGTAGRPTPRNPAAAGAPRSRPWCPAGRSRAVGRSRRSRRTGRCSAGRGCTPRTRNRTRNRTRTGLFRLGRRRGGRRCRRRRGGRRWREVAGGVGRVAVLGRPVRLGGHRLRLGRGAEPAGAAAVAVGRVRRDGECLLGQVVVDLPAAAGQGHDHQDQGDRALRPEPDGVGERGVVGEVQAAAARGQFEALGPAVDGHAGQRLAVDRGLPARCGLVGDPQDAALVARRDPGVGLDGPGADRNALALTAGRDHHHAGHLPVHPPQGAAVQLAEAADAGGRVEDPAHLAGCPVAYEDVADGEVAELAALVGAGARDQVGDDLVEPAVAARRLGQFAVAEARAGAADQAVRDGLGRGAAEDQGACLVAGRALLGHERGHLYGVAALQGAVRPADHPAEGGEDGGEAGGQGDQGRDGLAPAEALLGDPDPGAVGADECGGDQGGAVDEGGGSGPGRAVGERREEQADERGGPGRADGELPLAAQQGREGRQHDAE